MTKALYRIWRPTTWQEIVGQEHIVKTLQNAVRSGHIGHAYLFSGPRGTGKTTTARLLAKAINCTAPDPANRPDNACEICEAINSGKFLDLIEIDAASNTSVEDVRELRDKINYLPSQGSYKVYIIDEVHMLSTAAFNALLKTLEEPPPHAIFILATTEPHKVLPTVLSRCQRFEFRRIPVPQMVAYLRQKTADEKIEVSDEALTLIARQATGSMRDAISLLDQLSSTGEAITLEMTQQMLGTATGQKVVDLMAAILEQDSTRGLQIIQQALDGGSDPRQFARQVVDYLRNLLLIKSGNRDQVEATPESKSTMSRQAEQMENRQILNMLRVFNYAANEMRNNWQPGLLLEIALVESIHPREAEQAEPTPPQAASKPVVSTPKSTLYQTAEPKPKPAEVKAPAADAVVIQKRPAAGVCKSGK